MVLHVQLVCGSVCAQLALPPVRLQAGGLVKGDFEGLGRLGDRALVVDELNIEFFILGYAQDGVSFLVAHHHGDDAIRVLQRDDGVEKHQIVFHGNRLVRVQVEAVRAH